MGTFGPQLLSDSSVSSADVLTCLGNLCQHGEGMSASASSAKPGGLLQVSPLVNLEAEFAPPAWMFGGRSYQLLPGGVFLAAFRWDSLILR